MSHSLKQMLHLGLSFWVALWLKQKIRQVLITFDNILRRAKETVRQIENLHEKSMITEFTSVSWTLSIFNEAAKFRLILGTGFTIPVSLQIV